MLAATMMATAAAAGALATATAPPPRPAPLPHADALDAPSSPLDLTSVTFGQVRERMILQVTTAGDWTADQLAPGSGRSICIALFRDHLPFPSARLCVISQGGAAALRYTRLDPTGNPVHLRPVKATVSRADNHSLRATFTPAAAGLPVGRYSWRAGSVWTDAAACATPGTCRDLDPDVGDVASRIVPVAPRGCVSHGPEQRRSGFSGRPEIALTFDDGPSRSTPAILHELETAHVPATFFVVGKEVAGHRALLQRMLRDGSMIGNHTLTHANVAGAGLFATQQIGSTQAIIRRASGFTPCLFRPPYGSTSRALEVTAGSVGLLTILWNVDPQDWRTPGVGSIVATVLGQTRPGSIILLHDGGGPRGQTVAALPTIIHTLTARGYRFVTVPQLLGLQLRL